MIKNEIEISQEFKNQGVKAIASILAFVFIYLLLIVSSISLTGLCLWGAIALVSSFPYLISVVLGLGIVSLGLLILFFLLKFIFKSNKTDLSHLIEVTAQDEPLLFEMIHEVVQEVGTSLPKRVYISADVNASVFYNSSFWSMLLPTRKNLVIGLGLINAIHKEELRAILSHEFGHFSQKTMKVGNYVYNVNQVIFNMLYDNESYDKLIRKWAEASGYFAIFIAIAVKIVSGIQVILRMMYDLINKSYMALSREMEFHADEIAAHITGYLPLKNSLLRMNLADYSYHSVLSLYERKVSENIRSKNILKEQLFVMSFIAQEDNIPIIGGLPDITLHDLNKYNKSKLVVKNQWASHPSTEERIKKLEKTNIFYEYDQSDSANSLFQDISALQEKLTDKVFDTITYQKTPLQYSLEDFKKEYHDQYSEHTFSKIFNEYYDNKNPIRFDIDYGTTASDTETSFDHLFNEEMTNLNYEAIALQNDIEVIKQINDKTIKVKTFDYDGKKYHKKDSNTLLAKLQIELDAIQNVLKTNDINIFKYFKSMEQSLGKIPKISEMYSDFFIYDKAYDVKFKLYTDLSEQLEFVNHTTSFDNIKANFKAILPLESQLRNNIRLLMQDSYPLDIKKDAKDNFETYLFTDWEYFGEEKYYDKNLEMLFIALNDYVYLLSRSYFLRKKELLDYKVSLAEESKKEVVSFANNFK